MFLFIACLLCAASKMIVVCKGDKVVPKIYNFVFKIITPYNRNVEFSWKQAGCLAYHVNFQLALIL